MPINSEIIERHAARVVLLDRDDRVLLFRCQEPGAKRSFWITPGGGLEGRETHEQAALRELYEETGLAEADLGPHIWTRTHAFPWLASMYRQREQFYLLRVDGHDVDLAGHTVEERDVLTEHRWWSASEIQAASDLEFAPAKLGTLLQALLNQGPLSQPIDVSDHLP